MPKFTDQEYLKKEQYRDSSNLDARVALHKRFSTNPRGWFPWVFDSLDNLPAQARVLELGCGTGLLWSSNVERIPPGWVITLSDLSEGMLQAAWRSLVVTGRAYKYERIDAQSIPYPDGTFDIVIANHMLFHVPDRALALREIHRILKPGGRLAASTIGSPSMPEMNEWIKRLDPAHEPASLPFNLESGAAELAEVFTNVTCLRYPDNLRITEVEPIMAYIQSGWKASDASEAALQELRAFLESELRAKKALIVTKDTGLFLAERETP